MTRKRELCTLKHDMQHTESKGSLEGESDQEPAGA